MAPAKQNGEKACHEWKVTGEHTINIHKHMHGLGFQTHVPVKEAGTPDMHRHRTQQSWAKGTVMSHPGPPCGPLEDGKRMKTHQTDSICWLPMFLSPPSKIDSQCGWELTSNGQSYTTANKKDRSPVPDDTVELQCKHQTFKYLSMKYLSQWYLSLLLYALESNLNQYAFLLGRGKLAGWRTRGRGTAHCIFFRNSQFEPREWFT